MIQLALYKNRRTLYNKGIFLWQKLWGHGIYAQVVHVEIVIDGYYYSSTTTGGIRKKAINPSPYLWEFITIDVSEDEKEDIKEWFNARIGSGYDWMGIFLSQIIPIAIHDPKKYFCSEACHAALARAGLVHRLKPSQWYSPARLAQLVRSIGQ
jgi:uncharacterized protein YycO